MIRQEISAVINRPIDEVFTYVGTDLFKNNPKWAPDIQSFEQTSSGPMGVGATARQVRLIRGNPTETSVRITEYEPNRKVSFESSGTMSTQGNYTFEQANGGTKLTLRLEMQLQGLGRMAEPIVNRTVKQNLEDDMGRLKNLLETGAASR